MVCSTGSFTGYHAWTDGICWCASLIKQRALHWCHITLEDFSTATTLRFFSAAYFNFQSLLGIEMMIFFSDGQSTQRYDSKPPPFHICGLKDLLHHLLGPMVSFPAHNARIGVFHFDFASAYLAGQKNKTIEKIRCFKACYNAGKIVLINKGLVGPRSNYAGNMAWTEKAVELQLRVIQQSYQRGEASLSGWRRP